MMFKCPVCKEKHIVPDNYDNKEYICGNEGTNAKTFREMEPYID